MEKPEQSLDHGTQVVTHEELEHHVAFQRRTKDRRPNVHGRILGEVIVTDREGESDSCWYWVEHNDQTKALYHYSDFELAQ